MSPELYDFNAPDADIILVPTPPGDTVFRVHRCILASASPLFRDMFTLPQPTTLDDGKLPQLVLSEDHSTIDSLLRFIYPVPNPTINNLDELVPVLGATVKYDCEAVTTVLRKILLSPEFVREHPTRVFAIACRFDLEDEAKAASRFTLGINILECPLSDDLKYITAYSYYRLLDLHRRRAKAAQELLKLSEGVKCMQCNGSSYGIFMAPKWWTEFEQRAKQELSVRPTTDVIFDLAFLGETASAAGCLRCPGSMFDSYKFLQMLKQQIDDLPATI